MKTIGIIAALTTGLLVTVVLRAKWLLVLGLGVTIGAVLFQ
jgi:hypothetical protein